MLASIWITFCVLATATTAAVISRRLPAVMGSLIAILFWLICAYGALNLVVIGDTGVAYRAVNQVLSFAALGGVVVNGVFLFAHAKGQLPRGMGAPDEL